MNRLLKPAEVRISGADFVKEMKEIDDEMPKATTLRALKYHISEEKAELEILEEIISKLIAIIHSTDIDKMTIEDKKQAKIFLFEIESYALDVVQKAQNIELQHIINKIHEEVGSLQKQMEALVEAKEKCRNIGYTSIQEIRDKAKDVFNFVMDVLLNETSETAEIQQITEIELD